MSIQYLCSELIGFVGGHQKQVSPDAGGGMARGDILFPNNGTIRSEGDRKRTAWSSALTMWSPKLRPMGTLRLESHNRLKQQWGPKDRYH